MQRDRIAPLPSADITNPSFLPKLQSLSSIPRSLNASISHISLGSNSSLLRSKSSLANPNEARPLVKNYVAPSTTTKRHGSDIKVIYHAEQLDDKWENILPLTLDPINPNVADHAVDSAEHGNSESFTTGQDHEMQNSPITFDSDAFAKLKNEESILEDLINKAATELVQKVLIAVNNEVVHQKEEALRNTVELLVEYILIESCIQESETSINDPIAILDDKGTAIDPGIQENHIQISTNVEADDFERAESVSLKESVQANTVKISLTPLEQIQPDSTEVVMPAQHVEANSNRSIVDVDALENMQHEQFARKIMSRALQMIDLADVKGEEDMEGEQTHRKMISGSWMVGRDVLHNQSELRDTVLFRDLKYSIKLSDEGISCGDLFHKKYALYFPIMMCDILSATFSSGGFLYVFFLQKRMGKGPKLRCIQLCFNSDNQAELWALTINIKKWRANLKNISDKQILLLVDKRSPDMLKLAKKYVCCILQCTGKLYQLREVISTEVISTLSSILASEEAKIYDMIVVFSNQNSEITDFVAECANKFFYKAQHISLESPVEVDAVLCASVLLNSKRKEAEIGLLSCSIKRDKGFIQKILDQLSAQNNSKKSIVTVAK